MEELKRLLEPNMSLTDEDLQRWAPYTRRVSYPAGAVLFREGEVCREVVVIASGLVRAFYLHEAREVNLRLLCTPGVAVALSSLITNAPAAETVAAVTEVAGYRLRLRDFEHDHPGTTEAARRILAEQHYLSMERRLKMLQWKSAAERYAFYLEHMEAPIIAEMPGYHVASYLGVTPESLSRVRARRGRGAS
ncbi:MAG: Crp/Fnr family transcriptional regulator [Polyangiaceae bacterium]